MIPIAYNMRNLRVRKTTSAATALGLALVVFVFSSVMMLANGLDKTAGRAAGADIAIVLRKGSTGEMESGDKSPAGRVHMVIEAKTQTPAAPTTNNCGFAGTPKPKTEKKPATKN